MHLQLEAIPETFPIAGRFVISRGAKTEAHVIRVTLRNGLNVGQGECVPYARYGETIQSVLAQIEAVKSRIESGCGRIELQSTMAAGAARNAIDCALWDVEAKNSGIPIFKTLGVSGSSGVVTAYTLSLGTPDEMGTAARAASHRPLLKIKVGGNSDIERLAAVREGAPDSAIIVDANEGWTNENIVANMAAAAALGVVLIEQPLPVGQDEILSRIAHPVSICADESVHKTSDLAWLADRYDAVNIKLDKSGGLTEALEMQRTANRLGLDVMIGCMVGTSLAMAPALMLAQTAKYVDLDGPLLLAKDRHPGLSYEGSTVFPPLPELWG